MKYKQKNKRMGLVLAVMGLLVILLLQFQQPHVGHPLVTENIPVPENIGQILRTACYDCHSNETQLKWFDRIAPASWLVAKHVKDGRKALNFSEWDSLAPPAQTAALYYALNKILTGEMPLSSYTILHPEARLSEEDVTALKTYLKALTPRKGVVPQQQSEPMTASTHPLSSRSVAQAPNGIAYIPDYRNWKAISTSDRFDNGTMRIIYGNDVAIKAIKEGHINPWPDGTVFAKAAWKTEQDSAGVIHNGAFWQVEFMIKDQKKYAQTKGWGWARWRGDDLKPYGNHALFTTECMDCHKPVQDNDLVFTMPLQLK